MSIPTSEQTVEKSQLSLVESLASFERAYSRWVEVPLQHSGLTYARMRLLGVLNRKGPQIMSALGDELVVSPRNVTILVDALEASGLVRRKAHPTDRRATVIELTPQGVETFDAMYTQHASAVSELFSNVSTDDQGELLRLSNMLGAELESRGIVNDYPSNDL
jgi:DNA-binding MarR family transcriptional regulator